METINVLLTTFPGLSLPSTLCIPFSSTTPISSVYEHIYSLLPSSPSQSPSAFRRLTLNTSSGYTLSPEADSRPISSLLDKSNTHEHGVKSTNDNILSLHLAHPMCGGKGGFGSQLRAAGGRMSSRKKRGGPGSTSDPQASSRNLDGRRIRTVAEAKALAEYLTVKPGMDKKQKDERRKRWEAIVEQSEQRAEEIREGMAGRKGRGDGQWVEEKEAEEKLMREAVMAGMEGGWLDLSGEGIGGKGKGKLEESAEMNSSEESREGSAGSDSGEDEQEAMAVDDAGGSSKTAPSSSSAVPASKTSASRKVFGWDDDDEDDDEDEV